MQHAEMEGGFHGDAEVELGQSMVTHGVAKIGELQFECGGEINEQLWGAGATLAAHFLHDGPTGGRQLLADQPDVVELGSGTGMTGLACACAGAGSVILTDQEAGVQRLEEAIEANAKPLREAEAKVSAAALPWGDLDAVHEVAPTGCDLIIGAVRIAQLIATTYSDCSLPISLMQASCLFRAIVYICIYRLARQKHCFQLSAAVDPRRVSSTQDVTYSPPNFDALLETCYEVSQTTNLLQCLFLLQLIILPRQPPDKHS
jgi:hypothetical protein